MAVWAYVSSENRFCLKIAQEPKSWKIVTEKSHEW